MKQMITYIAGPFFKPEQKDVISEIENLLEDNGMGYFSPREYGVIVDQPMTQARTKRIFDMNIRMVQECNTMIAVTDDFDPGTLFEIGAFYMKPMARIGTEGYGVRQKIITYSPAGYGANVMIARATHTHAATIDQLQLAIRGHLITDVEVTE